MIEEGMKVKFHYTLTVEGKVVESSHKGDPLEYVHGKDPIIPGLQKGLEGHREGEHCEIEVHADDGYGQINPQLLIEFPKEKLPPNEEIDLGSILTAKSEDGQQVSGRVKDIRPESVLVDFNHPLAGKQLVFQVEIVSVEAAA